MKRHGADDIATVRDREPGTRRSKIFGFLSLGWTGSFRTWHRYEVVYLLLAALGTPLVLSVHTIVSTDFATAVVPGWHTTIFPPYFVAGAIFSGMAMVLTLMLVARKTMRLEDGRVRLDEGVLRRCAESGPAALQRHEPKGCQHRGELAHGAIGHSANDQRSVDHLR